MNRSRYSCTCWMLMAVVFVRLIMGLGECAGEWTGFFAPLPRGINGLITGTIICLTVALIVFQYLENRWRRELLREFRDLHRERRTNEEESKFLVDCFIERPVGFLFRIGVGYREWDEQESSHNSRVLKELAELADGRKKGRLLYFSNRFAAAARNDQDSFRLPYSEHCELHELVSGIE